MPHFQFSTSIKVRTKNYFLKESTFNHFKKLSKNVVKGTVKYKQNTVLVVGKFRSLLLIKFGKNSLSIHWRIAHFLNILPLKLQFSVERSKSIFLQNINQLLFKTDFVFNNYSTFFTVNKSRYGSFQCGNHIATENIQCFLLILPFNLSGSRCFTFTKKFEQETCLFSWSRLM